MGKRIKDELMCSSANKTPKELNEDEIGAIKVQLSVEFTPSPREGFGGIDLKWTMGCVVLNEVGCMCKWSNQALSPHCLKAVSNQGLCTPKGKPKQGRSPHYLK